VSPRIGMRLQVLSVDRSPRAGSGFAVDDGAPGVVDVDVDVDVDVGDGCGVEVVDAGDVVEVGRIEVVGVGGGAVVDADGGEVVGAAKGELPHPAIDVAAATASNAVLIRRYPAIRRP
jgi:hypothetical protein